MLLSELRIKDQSFELCHSDLEQLQFTGLVAPLNRFFSFFVNL
jgi:hypothetical protein